MKKMNFNLRKQIFSNITKKFSIKHSQIIVIGAGTAGLSVSNQLVRNNLVEGKSITIFDKSSIHYYQPGYTKLAGGIIDSLDSITHNTKDFTKDFNFVNSGVTKIDPEHNEITTSENERWTYDQLVIAAGLEVKLDSIPGLKPLMDDPSTFVGTIYDPHYSEKVKLMRETFKGGRALFTQPPPPLKCGGAPQKIAYLCDDYWKKKGVKSEVHFFTPLPSMFAVKYYSDSLAEIVKSKGISPHYTSVLTSVTKGVATFKNTSDNSIFEEKFDFLHAVPLLSTPSFLHGNPLCNPAGFVTIDNTMRHKKFANVWAIGDCTDLPNAKTAAAVFSQSPVLVHNLETCLKNKGAPVARYDGYSSCPLYLSKGSLLLAEFKEYNDEKGNLVREVDESFHKGKQNIPQKLYYYIACSFTKIYPLGLKGRWYGKNSVVKPNYSEPSSFDIKNYYQYLNYAPYVFGIASLFYLLS